MACILVLTIALVPFRSGAEGVNKTAAWTNEDKTALEIIIDIFPIEEMPILFLESNCNGYTLTAAVICGSSHLRKKEKEY